MRSLIAVIVASWLVAGCAATEDRSAEIDALMESETYADFSGVIIVSDRGERRHAGAYGHRTAARDAPLQLDMEWRWASVTKMVLSLIALQEVEAGRLALDAPIRETVPALPEPVGEVTLRQLLTHTSGMANPDRTPPVPGTDVPVWATLDAADTDYCYGPGLAAPGERFDYNACDYIVLEDVLRAVTGLGLPELIEQRISAPLGLRTLRFVDTPGDDAQVVGTVGGEPVQSPLQLSALRGDAALVGYPADVVAIQQAFIAGRIIRGHALMEEFGRGNPELGYVALGVWGYEAELPGCDTPVRLIERQGHLKGTKALTLMAPELQRSLVAFSNREETDWGWIWQRSGLTFDLARIAFCDL